MIYHTVPMSYLAMKIKVALYMLVILVRNHYQQCLFIAPKRTILLRKL